MGAQADGLEWAGLWSPAAPSQGPVLARGDWQRCSGLLGRTVPGVIPLAEGLRTSASFPGQPAGAVEVGKAQPAPVGIHLDLYPQDPVSKKVTHRSWGQGR